MSLAPLLLLGALLAVGCRTASDGSSSQTSPPEPNAARVRERPPSSAPSLPSSEEPAPAGPAQRSSGEFPSDSATSGSDTSREPPTEKAVHRVAALGDSITDEKVGGGRYLQVLRKACPKSTFVDFGRGGDMTNQMRRRFEQELLPVHRQEPFDTLIVFGGVNDLYSDLTAGRTNDKIEEDLGQIYSAAREAGMRVVAVTIAPWGGFSRYFNERRGRSTRLLNSWILGSPAADRVDVAVDAYSLLSCGDPDRLCPAYEAKRPDGLHPGQEGHRRLGEALLERAFPNCR